MNVNDLSKQKIFLLFMLKASSDTAQQVKLYVLTYQDCRFPYKLPQQAQTYQSSNNNCKSAHWQYRLFLVDLFGQVMSVFDPNLS